MIILNKNKQEKHMAASVKYDRISKMEFKWVYQKKENTYTLSRATDISEH